MRGGVVGITLKADLKASSTCREELDHKGVSGSESAGKLA